MIYDLTIDAFYISIRNLEETVRYLGSLVSLQLFEKEFYNSDEKELDDLIDKYPFYRIPF